MNSPLIVAEVSCNHLGSLDRAMSLIYAASKAGADAVKFQCWTADSMCIAEYAELANGPWKGRQLRDLYRECFTPWDWFEPLFIQARRLNIIPFVSVFDLEALKFIHRVGCRMYKIASFEANDHRLLRAVAATGKPIYLSTGQSSFVDIQAALDAAGKLADITLMQCVSEYPSKPEDANLATMDHMSRRLMCPVGLSDHSLGIGVAVAAATMGATAIEKHLTLRRADGGPDAGFSMEPEEFAAMVAAVRQAAVARGRVQYSKQGALSRGLWVRSDVAAGETITAEMIASARPLGGLPAAYFDGLIGKRFARAMSAGDSSVCAISALAAAKGGYKEINLRAMKLLKPEGILATASCSYHLSEADLYDVITQASIDARRHIQIIERRGQATDHPVLASMPETRYLKFFLLRVL